MIGFVILSHRSESQLLRLVTSLNRLYDNPEIACHHDISQSPCDPTRFPANVQFVDPVKTKWGHWSVVSATLAALELLYTKRQPDWFVLLSAADFPARPAQQVISELEQSGADAFIDFHSVDAQATNALRAQTIGQSNPQLLHFKALAVRRMKDRHLRGSELWIPIVREGPSGLRLGRHTVHLPMRLPWAPFSQDLNCFYGDHWFTGNRRVAELLLTPRPEHLHLQRHLTTRACPDECYYQTVLCNEPSLVLHRDNKRYADWGGGGAHPHDLTQSDWSDILASGAHFARKFPIDVPFLCEIEEVLALSNSTNDGGSGNHPCPFPVRVSGETALFASKAA